MATVVSAGDEATNELVTDPQQQPAYVFMPVNANNLPDLVLDAICRHLPFKEVRTCAQVCRRWREYVRKCPRWRTIALGQEVNCHGALSEPFIESRIPEIVDFKLISAMPSFVTQKLNQAEENIRNVPIGFLQILLRHGSRLTSLDLSSMSTRDIKTQQILGLWSDGENIGAKQLKRLCLPRSRRRHHQTQSRPLTIKEVEAIHQHHPLLEHMSFESDWDRIFNGDCDFTSPQKSPLKSVELDVTAVQEGWRLDDVLFKAHSWNNLEFLTLVTRDRILAPVQKLIHDNVIANLKHLYLNISSSYFDVSIILYHGRKLEVLKVDRIRHHEAKPEPLAKPLEFSSDNVPKQLQSVTLGYDPQYLNDQSLEELAGIIIALDFCENLKEFAVTLNSISSVSAGTAPFDSAGSPIFLRKLARGETGAFFSKRLPPEKWSTIVTSFFVSVASWAGWKKLKGVLEDLPQLKTLYLYFDDCEDVPEEEIANMAATPLHSIQTLHATIRVPSPLLLFRTKFLKGVFISFAALKSFAATNFSYYSQSRSFYKIVEITPPGGLESIHVTMKRHAYGNGRSTFRDEDVVFDEVSPAVEDIFSDRLRNLRSLIIPHAQFRAEDLRRFISACPLMEVFKVGFAGYSVDASNNDMVRMADLLAISQWRHLRDCHVLVRLNENELADDPPDNPSPRFADAFLEVKDKELMNRLIAVWKRHLVFLRQIEIVGFVNVSNFGDDEEYDETEPHIKPLTHTQPLIFGRRCGLDQLHFTWARCSHFGYNS